MSCPAGAVPSLAYSAHPFSQPGELMPTTLDTPTRYSMKSDGDVPTMIPAWSALPRTGLCLIVTEIEKFWPTGGVTKASVGTEQMSSPQVGGVLRFSFVKVDVIFNPPLTRFMLGSFAGSDDPQPGSRFVKPVPWPVASGSVSGTGASNVRLTDWADAARERMAATKAVSVLVWI